MLKISALPLATIVTMTVVCQSVQAQTPASKSVNQPKSEIQQLRSDVDELRRENEQLSSDVQQLRSDVQQLNYKVSNFGNAFSPKSDTGLLAFLYGIFCALWAQNTRRNPWLWFFLGLFFNVITVLFMLAKNSDESELR